MQQSYQRRLVHRAGHTTICAYCVCMWRVLIPIFSVLAAATVAILSKIIAHNGFGIATDAIRTDALRAAACAVIVLTFGILVKRNR